MPNHNNNAMGDTDILDELLTLLEGNGEIPDDTRNRILVKAQVEILRRIRKIEKESLTMIVRREPVRAIIYVTAGFVLLHEFATYVNIDLFIRAAARMMGVPIE